MSRPPDVCIVDTQKTFEQTMNQSDAFGFGKHDLSGVLNCYSFNRLFL